MISSTGDRLWEYVNDDVNHGKVVDAGEVWVGGIEDVECDVPREIYLLIFAKGHVVDHLHSVFVSVGGVAG